VYLQVVSAKQIWPYGIVLIIIVLIIKDVRSILKLLKETFSAELTIRAYIVTKDCIQLQ
jgi:hypothetical protein